MRSAWLGKLGVNMNFREFLDVIWANHLRESEILSPPWILLRISISTATFFIKLRFFCLRHVIYSPNTEQHLLKIPYYRPKNYQIPNTVISYAPASHHNRQTSQCLPEMRCLCGNTVTTLPSLFVGRFNYRIFNFFHRLQFITTPTPTPICEDFEKVWPPWFLPTP